MKTVLDPICGMEVDPQNAAAIGRRGGEKFYFCSEHCCDNFLQHDTRNSSAHDEHSCCRGEHHDKAHTASAAAEHKPEKKYFCPMCEGVESDAPGSCAKCGLALERNPLHRERKAIYTCPMHPEVEQDGPGSCPICGMALEPKNIVAGKDEDNSELRDMARRLWIGAVLSAPVFVLGMWHMLPAAPHWLQGDTSRWTQFLLSTPVVLWCGWPFFVRGWQSLRNRSLNMFTLIAMGVGASYFYSAVVMLLPNIFPLHLSPRTERLASTSKQRRSSPCSCYSDRCSSCAPAAARAAPSGRCWTFRRALLAWCVTAKSTRCRSMKYNAAIVSGFDRAKKFPSMAS